MRFVRPKKEIKPKMIDPEKTAESIRQMSPIHAKAKAERSYLEEFKSSKKALLMKDALNMGVEAANAQEREAKADPEYIELLRGLRDAIEIEETLRWNLEAAKLDIEIWRTQQANQRLQVKSHE